MRSNANRGKKHPSSMAVCAEIDKRLSQIFESVVEYGCRATFGSLRLPEPSMGEKETETRSDHAHTDTTEKNRAEEAEVWYGGYKPIIHVILREIYVFYSVCVSRAVKRPLVANKGRNSK